MNIGINYYGYYQYLFSKSWPLLLGLIIVLLFLGFRIARRLSSKLKTSKGIFKEVLKNLPAILALVIYFNMYFITYPDWLNRPAVIKGRILSFQILNEGYYVDIQYGEEVDKYQIDADSFRKLAEGDVIQIKYLPQKKEIYECTLLSEE